MVGSPIRWLARYTHTRLGGIVELGWKNIEPGWKDPSNSVRTNIVAGWKVLIEVSWKLYRSQLE